MIVLVCGSRDWDDVPAIQRAIDALDRNAIVVHGGAIGTDKNAGHFATQRGLFVAEMRVKGQHWDRYGKRAGPARNHAMLDLGVDLVLAFQRKGSKGTQSTIDEARRRGIPVEVHAA